MIFMVYYNQEKRMDKFGQERNLTMVEKDIRILKTGLYKMLKSENIYRSTYKDSLGNEKVFGFKYGLLDTYIHEEVNGSFIELN
jgi:hypothetical protein